MPVINKSGSKKARLVLYSFYLYFIKANGVFILLVLYKAITPKESVSIMLINICYWVHFFIEAEYDYKRRKAIYIL